MKQRTEKWGERRSSPTTALRAAVGSSRREGWLKTSTTRVRTPEAAPGGKGRAERGGGGAVPSRRDVDLRVAVPRGPLSCALTRAPTRAASGLPPSGLRAPRRTRSAPTSLRSALAPGRCLRRAQRGFGKLEPALCGRPQASPELAVAHIAASAAQRATPSTSEGRQLRGGHRPTAPHFSLSRSASGAPGARLRRGNHAQLARACQPERGHPSRTLPGR
jgi:hypothetical protein